jgi:mRNA interferase HigB
MVIRNRRAILKAFKKHAAVRKPLAERVEIAEAAQWHNIVEARSLWPSTDAIRGTNLTCFNIGGNNFRLIAIVSYELQEIVIDEVLTHAEYSKKHGK